MRNERNLREHSMPSNRWVVLALLFSVRVSTGIQYQAVASLSPQLMSGFVLSIADIGLLIGLYHTPGTILAFPKRSKSEDERENDRAECKKVLELAQAREIDTVLVSELTRWGRSTLDLMGDRLQDLGPGGHFRVEGD